MYVIFVAFMPLNSRIYKMEFLLFCFLLCILLPNGTCNVFLKIKIKIFLRIKNNAFYKPVPLEL